MCANRTTNRNGLATLPAAFSGHVYPETGIHTRITPEKERILHGGCQVGFNHVRIIEPIIAGMPRRQKQEFKDCFGTLRASPQYPKSVSVAELLQQLIMTNGRLNKRLRGKKHAQTEEHLICAGLLYTLEPDFLREIGLTEIAEIIAGVGDPHTPSQWMLRGAIEWVSAHDRKPTLLLLAMIQEHEEWDVGLKLIIACLILDFANLNTASLSTEEIRAQSITRAFINKHGVYHTA